MRKIVFLIMFQAIVSIGVAQELMKFLEDSDVGQLLDMPGVVALADGTRLAGTVTKAFLSKGQLTNVSLKLQDGSTRKFKPSELESVKVNCNPPTMFSVVDNDGNLIKKVIYRQFVYEHPFKEGDKVKPEMKQLLNPVFDSRIKVFAEPSTGGGRSVVIKSGAPVSGPPETLIFVKGSEVISVKQRGYREQFSSLYGDCEKVIQAVSSEQIDFNGVASHVLLYDHYCGTPK